MAAVKPPKLPPVLTPVADFEPILIRAIDEQQDIQEMHIKNVRLYNTDFGRTGFKNVIFENAPGGSVGKKKSPLHFHAEGDKVHYRGTTSIYRSLTDCDLTGHVHALAE